jgi:cytochrome c6
MHPLFILIVICFVVVTIDAYQFSLKSLQHQLSLPAHVGISASMGIGIFAAGSIFLSEPSKALAADLSSSSKIFNANCAACHGGGGNLFNPGKTLKLESLKANGYYETDKLIEIIRNGKGMMPAYGAFKSPKGNMMAAKLSDSEMRDLAVFIQDQANAGWPKQVIDSKMCNEYPGC